MKRRAVLFMGLAAVALAGCGGTWGVRYDEPLEPELTRDWRLARVSVSIPEALTVSEDDTYAPNADIVWHGEPMGDRRAQVSAILKEGIAKGAKGLHGGRPVIIAARLNHFHAVTPTAVSRAPGAVHNISYDIQVFDARTGKPLSEAQRIAADLEANVGYAAVVALLAGETQRVRIVRHLAAVTEGWLGLGPDQRRTFTSFGR